MDTATFTMAEVKFLWAMIKPSDCLKYFYRRERCFIDKVDKRFSEKKNQRNAQINSKNKKTHIIVKEHFSQHGKTIEELLTDVVLEKVKQTMT